MQTNSVPTPVLGMAALPVALLKTSLSFEHALSAQPVPHEVCRDGDTWDWDGVRFEMLHPRPAAYLLPVVKSNDLSCVLMVSAAGSRMLLTGDIESVSELDLVARHGQRLRADVLLAPHHGSRTSSSEAFLDAVGAARVILPVGYRNRFRHPNGEVMARYQMRAAAVHRTDRDGAVRVLLGPDVNLERTRELRKRYWHTQ